MYIRSMSFETRSLINQAFYDEATITFAGMTPYQKERLLKIYRESLDCYVTQSIKYNIIKSSNDSTYGIKVAKVIYHNPATIVFWSDGTKTVVKCDKNDTYDPEKGFYIACAKKLFGNNYAAVGRINKALEMAEDKND